MKRTLKRELNHCLKWSKRKRLESVSTCGRITVHHMDMVVSMEVPSLVSHSCVSVLVHGHFVHDVLVSIGQSALAGEKLGNGSTLKSV